MIQPVSRLKTKSAILLSVCALLMSCTEDFNIRTDSSPPAVVIYGTLTNELDYQYVYVSMSSSYFDTLPNQGISKAKVRITSSSSETFLFEEIDTVPGTYRTVNKVVGIPGKEYTLNVDIQFDGNIESYTAKSEMTSPIDVDSVNLYNMNAMGRNIYALQLYAMDPPEENFYLSRFKLNDSLVLHKKISRLLIMDDLGLNGLYINGMVIRTFTHISEKKKEDADSSENSSERIYISPGDTLSFAIGNIEKGYYDFITQCKKERNGENPFFGGPPSNIVTNLSNGAFGYFACCTFSAERQSIAN